MNYYQPLQKEDTKRWDYCCHNKRTGTYPIGYCAGWRDFNVKEAEKRYGTATAQWMQKEKEENLHLKEKYHKGGHASSEAACECYRQYCLDTKLRLNAGTFSEAQYRCQVEDCLAWAQKEAQVDHQRFILCEEHMTTETVASLFSVGTSFGNI